MSDADRLKAKLQEWKHRLNGGDIHSIGLQIGHMLWRSAFYRSINESRRFLPEDETGEKQANGPLHELIHDGYITMHAAATRGEVLNLLEKETGHILVAGEHTRRPRGQEGTRIHADGPADS